MVECWQLWITVEAVQLLANQLHGNNDIIAHHAKFGKFYCDIDESSCPKKKKSSRWIETKESGTNQCFFFCDDGLPDCAHM